MKLKIAGKPLPNLPRQSRAAVGCLCAPAAGRCAGYSGAADPASALCFGEAVEIVPFIKDNPLKK